MFKSFKIIVDCRALNLNIGFSQNKIFCKF